MTVGLVGRAGRVPGRVGVGAVTPGITRSERFCSGLGAAVLGVVDEEGPVTGAGAGNVDGADVCGTREGGSSGGAWSWASASLALKTIPASPQAEAILTIAPSRSGNPPERHPCPSG